MTIVHNKPIFPKSRRKSTSSNTTDYWDKYRGLSWKQFNDMVGMPVNTKTGLKTKIYQYEDDLIDDYIKYRKVFVKKATGLGITEITNRFIGWLCTRDDTYKNTQVDVAVVIFTGASTELAIRIIDRIKALFPDYDFKEKERVGYFNGAKVEAFPSTESKTARGLSPFVVLIDEGDFFKQNDQEEVRTTAERYNVKTDPYIIFISTPNLPGGLFENIEKEEPSIYHKVYLPYTIGLRDGMFNEEEIERGKLDPSFEREYNLRYGVGIGNIFPYEMVKECIESYPLSLSTGIKLITVDPAYGSSNFAILGFEQMGGITYIKDCIERERPNPSAMMDELLRLSDKYSKCLMLVDSAHPGLIRDLQDKGINAQAVNFGAMSEDNKQSLISKMTFEASQAVKEKRVRIHTSMEVLANQLKSVRFNAKGHPDKTQLNFDAGDCFIMGMNHLKSNKIKMIVVNTFNNEEDEE